MSKVGGARSLLYRAFLFKNRQNWTQIDDLWRSIFASDYVTEQKAYHQKAGKIAKDGQPEREGFTFQRMCINLNAFFNFMALKIPLTCTSVITFYN